MRLTETVLQHRQPKIKNSNYEMNTKKRDFIEIMNVQRNLCVDLIQKSKFFLIFAEVQIWAQFLNFFLTI